MHRRKPMNSALEASQLHLQVLVYLTEPALDSLACVSLACSRLVRDLKQNQYYYYLRLQVLVERDLETRPNSDWRRAFYALSPCVHYTGRTLQCELAI